MVFFDESINHVQDTDLPDEIADDKNEINQDTLFELLQPGGKFAKYSIYNIMNKKRTWSNNSYQRNSKVL